GWPENGMRVSIGLMAIGLAAAVALAHAQASDTRLTIADVARISGDSGVAQVARGSMTGAGGELNFVGSDKKLLLMVNFGQASLYDRARQNPMLMHALVPGLGDEAFDAPAGELQYVLYVKKGTKAISVTTFFVTGARPMKGRLSAEQLKAVARTILPRL